VLTHQKQKFIVLFHEMLSFIKYHQEPVWIKRPM